LLPIDKHPYNVIPVVLRLGIRQVSEDPIMLSPVDTAVICGLALLLFGPKKFPEIGKALGQGLGNFKKALTEAQEEVKSKAQIEEKPPASSEEEHKAG
jgi:sec-independent protein translocase protein TatA